MAISTRRGSFDTITLLRYWWVNQKQTFRHEIAGGYLWSPKRRADNARNQFYENMRIVAPGDVVFSYWNSAIRAYGIIRSFGYDAPKPEEFGEAGRSWAQIGYRSDVEYIGLTTTISPRTSWSEIEPLLPEKYSPLRDGKGLQSVYLAALPDKLGKLLWELVMKVHNPLIARDPRSMLLKSSEEPERELWETHEVAQLDGPKSRQPIARRSSRHDEAKDGSARASLLSNESAASRAYRTRPICSPATSSRGGTLQTLSGSAPITA